MASADVGNGLPPERRAPIVAQHEIDSDPRRLRSTLNDIEASLGLLEPETRRRISLLSSELIALSLERRVAEPPLVLTIYVSPSTARLEQSGLDLPPPSRAFEPPPEDRLARWWIYVEDLADRWGLDRRAAAEAWFEVDRHKGN